MAKGGDWLGSEDRFTAADLNVSVVHLGWAGAFGPSFLAEYPHTQQWLARYYDRPQYPYNPAAGVGQHAVRPRGGWARARSQIVVVYDCSSTLYRNIAKIFGASISEATMRANPRLGR